MGISKMWMSSAAGLVFAVTAGTAGAQQVVIWCLDNGYSCPTLAPVVERYNAANPDTTVVLEQVAYQIML
ncbi:hypothetical protein, partial [Roseinatronobacter sp.]|uniref:hypothetical protein n=1 Tax=Roseinatronobacter sp. TaxID=1945755 RepID=UPI003F6F9E4A